MTGLVVALAAALGSGLAGWVLCWWRLAHRVNRLAGLVADLQAANGQLLADLTAIPPEAVEHRRAAAAWWAKQIDRMNDFHIGQGRAA